MKRIIVSNISKKFKIGFRKNQGALFRLVALFFDREQKRVIEVLKGVSFEVSSGEMLGIVGKNGSGKSTLLRIIAGIYSCDSGRVITNGKIIPIINLNVGLKERLTMKNNIFLCCSLLGLGRKEIKIKFNSIVGFSELKNFIDTKIYQFSEGMKQRLSFSIAIHCNPDILLLDEILEVGDEKFKEKSGNKIIEMVKKGCSVILVSHDIDIIRRYCNRVIMIDNGRIFRKIEV